MSSQKFGIDVAKWNGIIDWTKVQKDFAILKVTKKNNDIEDSFNANYVGATEAGIPVGGYRYVYARNIDEATKEAESISAICKGKRLPYGIWLDMEDKSIRNLGKVQLSNIISVEAYILRKNGLNVGIYCNKDWFFNVLDGTSLVKSYPFWVARYPLADDGRYNEGSKLNPNSFADAWQYSSKGRVDGIKGDVDLDVAFVDIPRLFVASPTLKKRDVGQQVIKLQTNLNTILQCQLDPDGKFGPRTNDALMSWQSAAGLKCDGSYGPISAETMRNILA